LPFSKNIIFPSRSFSISKISSGVCLIHNLFSSANKSSMYFALLNAQINSSNGQLANERIAKNPFFRSQGHAFHDVQLFSPRSITNSFT
jgi:hypothetical protein